MNKTTILELMNKIDYNNDINKNVLNYNIEILMKYYTQLKNIFKDYKINNIILKHEELNIEDSNKIIKTLLSKYKYKELNKFIIETKKLIRINYRKNTYIYRIKSITNFTKKIYINFPYDFISNIDSIELNNILY